MLQAPTPIPADVRERIIAAASELFENSGRLIMPTVDAVRRAARVDMNAASSVMKEFRRAQIASTAPMAVVVPESLQQASSAALASVWQQAKELANESLRSSQAAWETERAELDSLRHELAEAFELQVRELSAAEASLKAKQTFAEQQGQELIAMQLQLADAVTRADKTEALNAEIGHRAADLRSGLDRAHADAERLRTEYTQARHKAEAEIESANTATAAARAELNMAHADAERLRTEYAQLRQQVEAEIAAAHSATAAARDELIRTRTDAEANEEGYARHRMQAMVEAERATERLAKAEGERDEATKAASAAREHAAGLAGQLQVMQEQNVALLAAIKPHATKNPIEA